MLYHRIIHTTRPLQSIVQQFNKQIINVRVRSLSSTSNNNNNTNKKKNNESLVKTKIEECGTIAQMILNRPPVNSLSLEMCTAISSTIKTIESNPKIQSIILSSSNPAILSAGLDLTELYNPNQDRLPQFWNSFQQVFLDIYGSRCAIVSAIEGHAPAAGCMLAMACDYRIMASSSSSSSSNGKKSGTIGLNEAQFGILAPPWLGQLMIRTIGFRKAEEALSLGTLYTPEKAYEIGLVDKIVQGDKVLETSYSIASQFAKIPSHARYGSKMLARKQFLDDLIDTRVEDTNYFCNFIQDSAVQNGIGDYLLKLKQKN